MREKVTNLSNSIRRLKLPGGRWVFLPKGASVILEAGVDPSQNFIRDSKIFKVEPVDETGKKIKKKKEGE